MGIDISAKMIYGVPYKDLPEEILEEVDDLLDSGELDYASPWYDTPRHEWIIGVEMDVWGDKQSDLSYMVAKIEDDIPDILDTEGLELGALAYELELGFYVSAHIT